MLLKHVTLPQDYLDDLLNIDKPYFEQMVGQLYPTELQLNKANSFDTEAPFLDLVWCLIVLIPDLCLLTYFTWTCL